MAEKEIIDVRQAVQIAREYLFGVIDHVADASGYIEGLRLEETELSEDRQHWLITLGFDIQVNETGDDSQYWLLRLESGVPLAENAHALLSTKRKTYDREYKLFTIDSQSGEVKSMKSVNQEINHATGRI